MKKEYVLIILLMLFAKSISAQETMTFQKVFYDKPNEQSIAIYLKRIGIPPLLGESLENTNPYQVFSILKFGSNTQMSLEKNELVCGISNGILITSKFKEEKQEMTLKSYEVLKGTVILQNQTAIKGWHSISIIENAIILSDEEESYGMTIQIYDFALRLKQTVKPFDVGFERAVFTASHDQVFIIACVTTPTPKTLYLEVNLLSGNVVMKKEINRLNPIQLLYANNKIVVVESDKITLLENGKPSWEKRIIIPHNDILVDKSQNTIVYTLLDKIEAISLEKGTSLWSVNISDIYERSKDLQQYVVRLILFKSLEDGQHIACILSEMDGLQTFEDSPRFNPNVYLINSGGKIIKPLFTDEIKAFDWIDVLKIANHSLKFITNHQEINYHE